MITYTLAIISILLGSVAQYLLKIGATGLSAKDAAGPAALLREAVSSPHMLGGITCYGASLIFWLMVLSRMELSRAYPLVSLGYIFTLLIGAYALDEHIPPLRIIGVALIIAGVILIVKS